MIEQRKEMISVIVPVYNAMPYLIECVESIRNQDFLNIEVIFIDDGSEDESYSYLLEQAKKDSRLKVIHQNNQGPSVARNRGLSEAKGDWIAFIDADDIVTEDYLSYLYNIAVENHCLISSCGYETQTVDGKIISGNNIENKVVKIRKNIRESYDIPYTVWHLLISSKVIKENNIRFDESITYLEDALFIYNILLCTGKYINGEKIGYRRIDHRGSLTNNRYEKENFDKWFSSLSARYKICLQTVKYPVLFAGAIYELSFFCNEFKILYKEILKDNEEKQTIINNYIRYCKKSLSNISNKQVKRKGMTILCLYMPIIFFKFKGITNKE